METELEEEVEVEEKEGQEREVAGEVLLAAA